MSILKIKKILQYLVLSCLCFNALLVAAANQNSVNSTIDSVEQKIVTTIKRYELEAIAVLEKAVNINSGTMNFAGVKKVGELFSKEFESLGFKIKWISADNLNRAGHLLASYGSAGPKILMIGHLDTVFTKHSPFQKFQRIDPHKVKGPGITDMKGGVVIILQALKALKQTGLLNQFQFKVVLTGDEENRARPVKLGSKVLLDAGKWADIALGFEDGDGNSATAVTSRRGSSNWHLEVFAKASHSSQIFKKNVGYGAIYEAARILQEFRTALAAEENLTYNPGMIIGGTTAAIKIAESSGSASGKNNVVAKTAQITGDIRAVSPLQLKRAWKIMEKIVSNNLNGTSAKITFDEGYPPMAASMGNAKLLALYSKASVDHGFGVVVAVNPRNAGAADISFVANDVEMALDGLGLMGVAGHTVNETADMDSMTPQTIRAAILIYRLLELYD